MAVLTPRFASTARMIRWGLRVATRVSTAKKTRQGEMSACVIRVTKDSPVTSYAVVVAAATALDVNATTVGKARTANRLTAPVSLTAPAEVLVSRCLMAHLSVLVILDSVALTVQFLSAQESQCVAIEALVLLLVANRLVSVITVSMVTLASVAPPTLPLRSVINALLTISDTILIVKSGVSTDKQRSLEDDNVCATMTRV